MVSSNIINISEVEHAFPIKYHNFADTQYNTNVNNVFNNYMLPSTNGIGIGVIEIGLFLTIGSILRDEFASLRKINIISYFWLLMTVLTGIWEFAFISQYKDTHNYAEILIQNDTHIWASRYDLSYVNPWKLSKIFYAEYGAHADREYIALDNHWSRVIEGSHAALCGLFALLAIYFKKKSKNNLFIISATVSMSTQLMNSILYMAQYFFQVNDPSSVNYPSTEFPCGFALSERGFMYVNVFWTLMPLYVIIMEYVLYGKDLICCYIQNKYQNKYQNTYKIRSFKNKLLPSAFDSEFIGKMFPKPKLTLTDILKNEDALPLPLTSYQNKIVGWSQLPTKSAKTTKRFKPLKLHRRDDF